MENIDPSAFKEERRRAFFMRAAIGFVVSGIVVGGFWLFFATENTEIETEMSEQEAEKRLLEQSDDPQCRRLIEQTRQVRSEFLELAPQLDKFLLSDRKAKVRELEYELVSMGADVDELKTLADEANFRNQKARTQFADWSEYLDTELYFIERLAKETLGEVEKKESDKTQVERKNAAIVALRDAMRSFRVWTSSGVHPCGEAEEGETPWSRDAEAESNRGSK
jgi:hypothetical protein